jgi:MFS family permease
VKCLNHQNVDAVAVCMGCGMALCPSCARRSPEARFVCSDECATRVSQFLSRAREGFEKTTRSTAVAGWYSFAIGAAFLLLGLLMGLVAHDWASASFFLLVGPIGVVAGIALLVVAKRAPNRTVERDARKSAARPSL